MRQHLPIASVRGAVLAAGGLGAITVLFSFWPHVANPTVIALSYLLVVVLAAAFSALWVAATASVAAVVLLNFFFLPPVGTLTIAEPGTWVALAVLLVVSLIASNLSSSARARAQEATAARDELARLFDLSRDILLTSQSEDAYGHLARSIARRFGLQYVAVCLPASSAWEIHEAGDGRVNLPADQLEQVLRAARAAFDSRAGERGYDGRQTIHAREGPPVDIVPLRVAGRVTGLLAVAGRDVEAGTRDALAGVAAIAIERVHLLEERERAAVERRSAELKSALLASLAHDLRTPLTAIRVAASNLQDAWVTDAVRQSQSEIVLSEVGRLNRLFQNILAMARIETEGVTAAPEWVTPGEIVEAAIAQVQQTLERHLVAVDAADDIAVRVDPRLTSAAIAHLLENAAQYSPAGTEVHVGTSTVDGRLRIVVEDQGPGIANGDMPHLFQRFFRGEAASGRAAGAGMGLAISRGLLAAEGGTIRAENRPGGGARFVVDIPAAMRPALTEAE